MALHCSDESGLTFEGPGLLAKALSINERSELLKKVDCRAGDLVVFGAGDPMTVATSLGRVRQFIGSSFELTKSSSCPHGILWITDFPMFEWNADANRFEALHHPFTAPNLLEEDSNSDLREATALAYDLVYNGVEVGGGSLRIYRSDIQRKVFEIIGISPDEVSVEPKLSYDGRYIVQQRAFEFLPFGKQAEARFGFLLRTFEYGAPPHGIIT